MGAFVLAGIVLSGAWTQLDAIGWPVLLLPILTFVLDGLPSGSTGFSLRRQPRTDAATPIILATLLCAIHLLHVALTAREEFGFGGDEGYHLSATRAFAIYFMKAGPYLAATLILYAICRRLVPRFAATIGIVALMSASMMLPQESLFGRYPTAFYLLSTPLNVAFDVLNIPYPFTANHIVNMLSLPVWLFALRPLVIGRWPDWRVMPVALLIYFQGPSIVYTSSGLLDPWSIIFTLLALEALVSFEPDRRWIAVLLASFAAVFKETAILFVPPIWVLSMIEWRGGRPSLRPNAISIGVTAIAPFVTYYMVRRGLHIFRGYEVAGSASVWTLARAGDWLASARFQLGRGGSISVAILAAWSLIGPAFNRRFALQHLVWVVSALALAVFFAADVASIPYTGYGRFLAYSLLALCGIMFATAQWLERERPTALVAITLTILTLQLVPTKHVLELDFKPDYERNSLEWSQGLVRYPFRTLTQRITDLPAGANVSRIRTITYGLDLISLKVAYPDLAERYELIASEGTEDCGCKDATEAVLAGFEWPAHFADNAAGHLRYDRRRAACVAQIQSTCASSLLEQRPDGSVIGALGAGIR